MANQYVAANTITVPALSAGDALFVQAGSQPVTGNIDHTAIDRLLSIETAKNFMGSIGTGAAPFKGACSGYLAHMGSGEFYWESNSTGGAETTAIAYMWGSGKLHCVGAAAAVTRLEGIHGRIHVENSVTVTTLRIGGHCKAEVRDSGSGPAVVTTDLLGGDLYSQRPHTTINAHRGAITLDQDDTGAANAHGTINVNGASLVLRDSGTVTQFNWYAGTVDASQLQRPVIFTNSIINMSLPGAQALLQNPLITFSSNVEIMTDGRQL
jgi:hypothetical protein